LTRRARGRILEKPRLSSSCEPRRTGGERGGLSLGDPAAAEELPMKRSIALLLAAVSCWMLCAPVSASINLNSSRSNIYRLVYPEGLLDQVQVKSLLAALDVLGQVDEAKAKAWLAANFKNHGIADGVVQKIVVLPAASERQFQTLNNASRKEITIILLTNPADEKAAIQFATTVKSSKSNSQD
jgi:hypothetical protein